MTRSGPAAPPAPGPPCNSGDGRAPRRGGPWDARGLTPGLGGAAAANVDDPGVDNSMVINDDITYLVDDGSVGLIAVAEESILIPLLSPDDMVVDGIFIAQNGYFGRNYYTTSGSRDVPSSYNSYVEQNSLTITGSIVSNGRVGTKWTCGGSFCSGYENRVNSYDRDLAINPPPMTPYVSDDYRFVRWLEVE